MMLMSDPKPNGAFAWVQEPWGRALRCTSLHAPHLFTTRALTLRDDRREWAAVARSMDVPPERVLLIRQVHGIGVAIARRGEVDPWRCPEADIILSDDPSVAIGVRVADCAPVLLFDPRKNSVGAVHAGWRGAAASAVGHAVEGMSRTFGTDPADLIAAIGPCLGACCAEVGPDVVDAFRAGGANDASMGAWFAAGRGDRWLLDLERANRDQLACAGVRPDAIFGSGLCTKTHQATLHSYRAHSQHAGRMMAAIRGIQ
jgi:polyphenol oxidase